MNQAVVVAPEFPGPDELRLRSVLRTSDRFCSVRTIEINPRQVPMNARLPATGWSNLVVTCDCGARWPLNVGLKGDISRAERRRLLVDGGALQLPLHEPGRGA